MEEVEESTEVHNQRFIRVVVYYEWMKRELQIKNHGEPESKKTCSL